MASNPFGITQVDAPGLIQMYTGLQQERMRSGLLRANFLRQQKLDARADTEYNRGEAARNLIAQGAKPEDVIKADPETGFAYASHATALEKAKREEQAQRADDVGSAAVYLNSLPDKDLATQWDGVIDKLVASGYTDLAAYKGKPNRAALGPIIADSDKAVKAYVSHLENSTDAAEKAKHDTFMEGIAARNSSISAGNLDLSRKREARITKWGPQPLIGTIGVQPPSNTDDLDY